VRLLRQEQAGDEGGQDPQALGDRRTHDDISRAARCLRRLREAGMITNDYQQKIARYARMQRARRVRLYLKAKR
jgi:hypothetical protein